MLESKQPPKYADIMAISAEAYHYGMLESKQPPKYADIMAISAEAYQNSSVGAVSSWPLLRIRMLLNELSDIAQTYIYYPKC